MLLREAGEGEQVGPGLLEQRRRFGEARLELVDDPGVLLVHRGGVGLGEDRAHHRRDEALGALGHAGEQVAHEVGAAALPGGARAAWRRSRRRGRGARRELTSLHAGEAAGDEAAQEREPGGAVLGGDDVEARATRGSRPG